jgi:two-component system NarL family sensor kinase
MKFSTKVFLLAVLPMLTAMLLTITLVNVETLDLSNKQAVELQQSLLDVRKSELINYTNLAFSAIEHLYQDQDIDEGFAQERVKEILTDLEYATDGYFYAYTHDGTSIVHPKQPYRLGNNYFKLTDPEGKPVIQELIKKATQGGGYTEYLWEKPSTGELAKKLGYSRSLDRWKWMVGTGMYIDDLDTQVATMQVAMNKHIKQTSFVILGIALVCAGLVFLSGLALQLNERKLADMKLQELTKRVLNTQDEERRRVSRELHDGISQSLVAIKYSLEEALSLFKLKDSEHANLVEKSSHYLDETMQEVRRISRDLHPSILDDFGLMAAVDALVTEFGKRLNIKVDLVKVKVRNLLPQDAKTALYRVTQEALTNIERHANATHVEIEFKMEKDWFQVRIADNGRGFNFDSRQFNKTPGMGIGLRNMSERLSYFKGKFEVHSSVDGTVIVAAVPKTIIGIKQENKSETV